MTDQAVDTGGVRLSEDTSPEGQFLGRARELKELRADIERAGLDTIAGRKAPRARVLLIAGKPGSGRSALAAELVRQVADRYDAGVFRARLSEPDGTPVPTERTARELLTALELPTPAGASEDDLSDILREALTDRRALLLLDDAADAEQVDALLPDSRTAWSSPSPAARSPASPTSAPAPWAASTPSPRWNSSPATPARSASPSTRSPPRASSRPVGTSRPR